MKKYSVPSLTTGQFAKLCATTKRTLFHYDEIGLFSPALTDEKGYRFYTEQQCDVFSVITALKEMDMPLSEIKGYLDAREPVLFESLLSRQKQKLDEEMEHLKRLQILIHTKLALLDKSKHMQCNQVTLEDCQEESIVLSAPLYTSDHRRVLSAIYEHIGYCFKNGFNIGHPYGAMIAKEQLLKGEFDTYACFFTKTSPDFSDMAISVKPAGLYAVTYLKGDYYQAEGAYRLLLDFISKNGYQMMDFSYKEGIIDEVSAKDVEQYVTKISIHIQPSS